MRNKPPTPWAARNGRSSCSCRTRYRYLGHLVNSAPKAANVDGATSAETAFGFSAAK